LEVLSVPCSFQRKVVSIPLWFDWKTAAVTGTNTAYESFNSTLVRLEVILCYRAFIFKSVSIPLWFDWKLKQVCVMITANVFQFHFGSIGRECFFDIVFDDPGFNSTLVRLEEKTD